MRNLCLGLLFLANTGLASSLDRLSLMAGEYELAPASATHYFCKLLTGLTLEVENSDVRIFVAAKNFSGHDAEFTEEFLGVNTSRRSETCYINGIGYWRTVFTGMTLKEQELFRTVSPRPSSYEDRRTVLEILSADQIAYHFSRYGDTRCILQRR